MKRFFCFFVLFILVMFAMVSVKADSAVDGTVDITSLNYLSGIVRELDYSKDYVIFRTGDYTTSLVYGDIDYDDHTFSGSNLMKIVYNRRYGSGRDYTPAVLSGEVSTFTLTVSDTNIIYSNLGNYAKIEQSNNSVVRYILYAVIFFGLLFVLFKFIRTRGRTI